MIYERDARSTGLRLRGRITACAALLLLSAATASGQGTRHSSSLIEFTIGHEIEYDLGTCSCGSGTASPVASAFAVDLLSGQTVSCAAVTPDAPDGEIDSDTDDPCPSNPVGAIAAAASGAAIAQAEVTVDGTTTVHSQYSTMFFALDRNYVNSPNPCTPCQDQSTFDVGLAWTISPRSYTVINCTDNLGYSPNMTLILEYTHSDVHTSGCAASDSTFPGLPHQSHAVIIWVKADVLATPSSGSPVHSVVEGVMGIDTDGDLTRLGVFEEDEFDPINVSSGYFEIDGTYNPTIGLLTSPGSVTISETSRTETFTPREFGDLNRDGVLCRDDLLAHYALWSTTIGSAAYDPRADVDLDGTIDSTDAATIWEGMVCITDFNCDGNSDQDDVSALQTAIGGGALFTDVNHDGNSDQDDVYDLTTWIASGCP